MSVLFLDISLASNVDNYTQIYEKSPFIIMCTINLIITFIPFVRIYQHFRFALLAPVEEDNRVAEASAFGPFGFCGENSLTVIFFRKKCFGSATRLQHGLGTQAGEAER